LQANRPSLVMLLDALSSANRLTLTPVTQLKAVYSFSAKSISHHSLEA